MSSGRKKQAEKNQSAGANPLRFHVNLARSPPDDGCGFPRQKHQTEPSLLSFGSSRGLEQPMLAPNKSINASQTQMRFLVPVEVMCSLQA